MKLLTEYERFADSVEQCSDIEELSDYQKNNTTTALRNEFWKQRTLYFGSEDALTKQKALAKMSWLQQTLGCRIPLRRGVNQFSAPEGLYGIFISSRASIGSGCIIYPNVTIGSDMLGDSENIGFPIIGNNVYIGPGAAIIGDVIIGDNVRIHANSCITMDIPANSIVKCAEICVEQQEKTPQNKVLTFDQLLKKRFGTIEYEYNESDEETDLYIVRAVAEDIEDIMRLYRKRIVWFKCKNQSQWNQYLVNHPKEEFLEKIENKEYYLVKIGQKIVAGFTLSEDSSMWETTDSNAYYLRSAVSEVGYKNIGHYIVSEAKKIAQDAGKEYLRLECIFANKQLNAIWESLGFTFVKEFKGKYHFALREMVVL